LGQGRISAEAVDPVLAFMAETYIPRDASSWEMVVAGYRRAVDDLVVCGSRMRQVGCPGGWRFPLAEGHETNEMT
jgi:hypothetical protein